MRLQAMRGSRGRRRLPVLPAVAATVAGHSTGWFEVALPPPDRVDAAKRDGRPLPPPPPPPLRLRHQFNRRRDRRRGPQPRRPGGPVCAGHRSGAAASAWPLRQCLASVPRVISTTHHRRASGARGAATGRARRGGAGGGKSSSCRGGGKGAEGAAGGGGSWQQQV